MSSSLHADYRTPLLLSVVLVIGLFLGFKMARVQSPAQPHSDDYQLGALIDLIDAHYVDSIDKQKLYENGIEGILTSLDPHTVYIPSRDLRTANETLDGAFYGVGIEFYQLQDTVRISRIMKDGACYGTEMVPGDKLLKIDTQVVAHRGMSNKDIVNKMRGRQETEVRLSLLHPDNRPYSITLKRSMIAVPSVTASYIIGKQVGYIAISVFSETTSEEFRKALIALKKEGMTRLIIDVRDNPGGFMDAVSAIADELIGGKHLLIRTKGKQGESSVYSKNDGLFEEGKVAVLINENSASASEILAGIIQDLDRGIIVGRRSYGKGLVQEQFELPDASAIRITTARFYLPSGRCIQKNYDGGKEVYHHEILDRYKHGELVNSDSSHKITLTHTFYTTKKRTVYDQEGVMPDYFVGIDSAGTSALSTFLDNHMAEDFIYTYAYTHKQILNTSIPLSALEATYTHHQELNKAFDDYLHRHQLNLQPSAYALAKRYMLACLAKMRYDLNGESYIMAADDPVIQKAISVLND